jgi:hypothetical protein
MPASSQSLAGHDGKAGDQESQTDEECPTKMPSHARASLQ